MGEPLFAHGPYATQAEDVTIYCTCFQHCHPETDGACSIYRREYPGEVIKYGSNPDCCSNCAIVEEEEEGGDS